MITPKLLTSAQIEAMNRFLKNRMIAWGDITLSNEAANRLALLCQIEPINLSYVLSRDSEAISCRTALGWYVTFHRFEQGIEQTNYFALEYEAWNDAANRLRMVENG
jgi:endoglucanase Acf2